MQYLFQSTFLQSLGYAIANSLWQTALVWLIYTGVTTIGSLSAAIKYRLAVAAQVTGFAWFIVTFGFYYSQYSHALQQAPVVSRDVQAILSSNTDFSSRMINWMVKGEQLLPYVSMAYLLLMVFLCIRWLIGYRQTQQMRHNGLHKMPAEWKLFVTRIGEQLNIRKKIRVFLSDSVTTPLTIGFLKPVILIPLASINHLTTDQLEAVLLHEMAHIKRYDYIVNIILSVAEISLFFNPFTQLLSKNIRKERENSCDDWVLQFQYDASVYAQALLRIAYLQAAPSFAMTAVTGKKNELLVRVKRMIGEKEHRFSYRKQLLAFVIVTGILSSIAWLNPRVQHRDETSAITVHGKSLNKKPASYAVEPMAVSVDNPLFNPMFFLSKPLKEEMQKNIASAQKVIDKARLEVSGMTEPAHAIESLSPLVADAMEQASLALGNPAEFENETPRSGLNAAVKTEMGRSLYSDSGFFSPKLRKQFGADFGNSWKEAEEVVNKAKKAMALSFKTGSWPENLNIQKDKDLQKVMNDLGELGKLELGKLVFGSLELSSDLLNNIRLPRNSSKNKESPKTKQRSNANKADREVPVILDLNDESKKEPAVEKEKAGTLLPVLSSFVSLEGIANLTTLDTPAMARVKRALMKISQETMGVKVIPLLNKEKKEEDKVIIRFQ